MNKSEFKKAVADNEAPTPGYLYRDMANWTFVDYATQLQLIKALFDKLQMKNSAFVLYKALHLIKVLCETGQEGFQKELQLSKYTSVVKDFTTYRGPLDIKYGDSWNEKVRSEAQGALEAIFQTRVAGSSGSAMTAGGVGGDWSGTGSSAVEKGNVKGPWGTSSGGDCGTAHANELVMPNFASMNPYSSGSTSLQQQQQQLYSVAPSATSPAFDSSPSLHIGEMPSENRWAARQREMTAMGGNSKPSKTILQQIASTAKSGVSLMTQFEVLKGKQERLYGDQFGQAARATAGADASGSHLLGGRRGVDEVGSYQPVGLQMPSGPGSMTLASSPLPPPPTVTPVTTVSPAPAAAVSTASASASLPPPALPSDNIASHVSALAFASGPSSPAPAANSNAADAATELLHGFARLKQTPSRVELSRLVRVVEEGAAAAAAAQAQPDAITQDAYGAQLAAVLSTHLHKDRPWQERLNALASLEAVLRGCAAEAVLQGVVDFYTRQPSYVQVNYSVVQASLKEKAGKVAQLLHISPVPTTAPSVTPSNSGPTNNNNNTNNSSPLAQADATELGSQQSSFAHLLGSGSPSSPPPPPASPLAAGNDRYSDNNNSSSHADTFEGMTIRGASAGSMSSSTVRRADPSAAIMSSSGEGKSAILGGDGASRPQRRANRGAMPTVSGGGEGLPFSGSALSEGVSTDLFPTATTRGSASAIQVLRSSGPAGSASPNKPLAPPPQGQLQQQLPQHLASGDGSQNLDHLLGFSSTAPTLQPASSSTFSPAGPSALDDLFGGQSAPPLQSSATTNASSMAGVPSINATDSTTAFTADDLFGTGPSMAPPPPSATAPPRPSTAPSWPAVPSPQPTSTAQLARIQELMQYLETRYDPAAMRELETLILARQQELQQLSSQQQQQQQHGFVDGGMFSEGSAGQTSTGAAATTAQPHRQFQTGGARSGQASERQQANHAFADVQAEMKRKMEL